jgi:hypothetical protein
LLFVIIISLITPSVLIIHVHVSVATASTPDSPDSRARADYAFTIKCENNSHITNGGDPTGYFIDIENTGTKQDTIIITNELIEVTGGTEPDPKEWSAFLNKGQVTLNPGAKTQVILNVSTGCGCQLHTVATIRVFGESVLSPSHSSYIDTFTTRGPEQDRVELEKPGNLVFSDLKADSDLNFTLGVVNPSSNPQKFTIRNTKKPKGWTLDYNTEAFEVAQLSNYNFKVQTKIPAKNEPGEYKFDFTIKSLYDPYVHDSVEFEMTLLPELAIKKLEFSNPEPVPGEQLIIQVTIKNFGPALARDFAVNLYDYSEPKIEFLVGQGKIDLLYGNDKFVQNFTWLPNKEGNYNLTALVNPSYDIDEVGNRFGNNLETKSILVKSKSNNDNGGHPNNGDDERTEVFDSLSSTTLYSIIAIVIVLSVVVLYFISSRLRGSNSSERTAKKIPLSRQKSRGSSGRTAKKLSLDEAGEKSKRRPGRRRHTRESRLDDTKRGKKRNKK